MATGEKKHAKEKILNAAEEEFATSGFGGARTAEIASKAGVNKALLHYYFSTKDGLYQAVMDRLLFELIEIAQSVLKRGLKGDDLVEGIFDAFFDYAAKHRHFARLATVEIAGSQARYVENMMRNFFKPLFIRAGDHLRTEAAKGRLKKTDETNLLITLYLSTLSYFTDAKFIEAMTGEDMLTPKALKERKAFLKNLIRKALFKE